MAVDRWSRRQESNLYLPLRRRPFYPLNYGERLVAGAPRAGSLRPRRVAPRVILRASWGETDGRDMATVEGSHVQGGSGKRVGYRVDYDVVANVIHFRARFDNGASHEGEFDFDPAKLDAAAAVDAFMQNHIEKSDSDVAP
jgi:hypothetical protein